MKIIETKVYAGLRLAITQLQENDSEETLDRIFSYIGCANGDDGIHASVEDIYATMRKEGFISDTQGICIMFRPKNSICSSDIESIVRDIESDGEYEVKLIVHDYLKRLRPNLSHNDNRLDLGECANDLSELSKLLKLPIVTANQLNSDGIKKLMQRGENELKNDLGKNASLTMQSESQQISENSDVVITVNKEYLITNKSWYLTFTDLKNRGAKSNKTSNARYFATPFEPDNSMRLMEDEGTEEEYSINSVSDMLEKYDANDNIEDDSSSSENYFDDKPVKKASFSKKGLRRVSVHDEMESF